MPTALVTIKDQVKSALAAHASGMTLPQAAIEAGIDVRTVYAVARSDSLVHEQLLSASEACAAHMVRESLEIADKDPDAQRARVRVSARQWAASRMDRNRWGDKVELKVDSTVSITAALEAANARVQPLCNQVDAIELQVTDVAKTITREAPDIESVASTSDLPNPFD